MAPSAALDILVSHESNVKKLISSPPTALRRDDHAGHRAPSTFELEHLNMGSSSNRSKAASSIVNTYSGTQTPTVDQNDLESSRPASPVNDNSFAEIRSSLNNPPRTKWRYIGAVSSNFAGGLNDASIGVLIPSLEAQYVRKSSLTDLIEGLLKIVQDISYGVVSLIFLTNAVGFITAAVVADKLYKRLGRAVYIAASCAIMAVGYAMIIATPPFWVVCLAFFLTGIGMAMPLAVNNPFVSNLTNAPTLLGIMHGMYSTGGIISPIVATVMIDKAGIHWSYFFSIFLGVSLINCGYNYWANLGYESDKPVARRSNTESTAALNQDRILAGFRSGNNSTEFVLPSPVLGEQPGPPTDRSKMQKAKPVWRQTLSSTTILASAFIFVYQGAEVAISGWVLSFLLAYRVSPFETSAIPASASGYDPLATGASSNIGSLGYVNSGFWAGLTLSRLLATDWLARRLGEIWAISILTLLTAIFQTLTWLIPNLIAESVTIAIAGLFLGPIIPLAMVVFSRYVERKVQVGSLAIIGALGSAGGAVAPFLVGIISQGVGIWVLHPICLGLYVVMGITWFFLNKGRVKRSE